MLICVKLHYNADLFLSNCLQVKRKAVPLQCVFHSIRFKVNKGWATAVALFFVLMRGTPQILTSFSDRKSYRLLQGE